MIENQTLGGYGTLKLANVYKDPTFVREVISYEMLREFMSASRANFAWVTINGESKGLYTSVQSVDRFFLRQHFLEDEGPFFKGELTGMGGPGPGQKVVVWGYQGDDPAPYASLYECRSDEEDWAELVAFLKTFNADPEVISEVLDVDEHLWMLAFDILTVNLDAPINFGHNYYLYQDSGGVFHPVAWDMNENFGGFSMLLGSAPLSTSGLQHLDPFLNANHPSYPIVSSVLSRDSWRKMYVAHMRTLIRDFFDSGWFEGRISGIQDFIEPFVLADENKFYSDSAFRSNVKQSLRMGPQSIIGLTELMNARVAFIKQQPEWKATPPEMGEPQVQMKATPQGSFVSMVVTCEDATEVTAFMRSQGAGPYTSVKLWDDGAHEDGAASDGLFGVRVTVEGVGVEFYLFAENDQAGCFFPEYASHDPLFVKRSATVVVNEAMADNDETCTDEQGEFEDWIELHNTGDESVSLVGWMLSDEGDASRAWRLPELVLAPHDYLVIWADGDEEQGTLHADFKIDAEGETLWLMDPWGEVVDQVCLPAMATDRSWGRLPNGTGDFVAMHATPGTANMLAFGEVVIHEILAHSHADASDWIELFNAGSQPVPLGGWTLSDDAEQPEKYRFADDVALDAGGYLVVYETEHFGAMSLDPGRMEGFALSEHGETLYLFAENEIGDRVLIDQEDFGPSETGVSMGRHIKSTGTVNFVALNEPTPGAPNSRPRVGPVVISQIHYHPAEESGVPYLQLTNISDSAVTLCDTSGTDPWIVSEGLDFAFPLDPPMTLASGASVLLTSDAAALVLAFPDLTGSQVLTWGTGALDRGGEKLEICQPGDFDDAGNRTWTRVDRVVYDDEDPWPVTPDGQGDALIRRALDLYGNDPANWTAQAPDPGHVPEVVASRRMYPWLSNRAGQFESQLVANNPNPTWVNLVLTARREDGTQQQTSSLVPPLGFLQEPVELMFDAMGDGAGFSVELVSPLRAPITASPIRAPLCSR